jgi:hypothetical protein
MFVKLFEEFKETPKNTPLLYKDEFLEVKVAANFSSSKNQGIGTDWCSNSQTGFYTHSKTSNMYRFHFSDGYKLRLTWDYISQKASSLGEYAGGTHWGQGGIVDGQKQFYDILRPEDDSEPFYINWGNRKAREIVKRIQSIPQKAIDAVHQYQEKMSRYKSENLNKMYREIQKIKIIDVRSFDPDKNTDEYKFFKHDYDNNFLVKVLYLEKEFTLECYFDTKYNLRMDLGDLGKSFKHKHAVHGNEVRKYIFDKMMEWIKKNPLNESLENPDSVEDLFRELEIDYNLSIKVMSMEDEFSKYYDISISFEGTQPKNFSSVLLEYIIRSEKMTGLQFESVEMYPTSLVFKLNDHLIEDIDNISIIDSHKLKGIGLILSEDV